MWQRFTERARKTVFFAQEEAQQYGEGYVSTEHLLLGLLREADSVAARVLDRLGVNLTRLQEEVRRQLPRGESRTTHDMQLTPRAKRVIDLAYDEARQLNNNYIGTEHLLLGLVREGEGLAGRVLEKLGVEVERARRETMAIQDSRPSPEPSTPEVRVLPEVEAGRQYLMTGERDAAFHRRTAVRLYNAAWELLKKPGLTPGQKERMLTMSHAALYHWGEAGSVVEFLRSDWQLSRVYAVMGWNGLSLHYAARSLELCLQFDADACDLAFAHEAMARAYAISGDVENRKKHYELALETSETIEPAEVRDLFLKELETVPEAPAS